MDRYSTLLLSSTVQVAIRFASWAPKYELKYGRGFQECGGSTSWLEEQGFSEEVVDAFKGMRVWSTYSMGTTC